MRKIAALYLFMCLSCGAFAQLSFGESQLINSGWKFTLQNPENGKSEELDDNRWENITLPHDWSVREQLSPTLASCTGYLPGGIGWYRKELEIPQERAGQRVFIYFEGVYNRSEVFVNGKSIGKRPNGYVSFAYDITNSVEVGKKNLIAVKVDHSLSADSRWYTGSGIYRDVYLVYSNPLHIAQWGVYAFPKNNDTLSVEVEVANQTDKTEALTVKHELISPDGKVVAVKSQNVVVDSDANKKVLMDMGISKPQLWSLKNPVLYTLKTTVIKGKDIVDCSTTRTGFRNYTFDPNKGFALNGEQMKVKGVCLHHDAGVLGSAVPRQVWKRRLQALKEIGVNAIRTSHNPQSPDLYELCDELGLLVMNEAYDEWEHPKRKWMKGWNVGTPEYQGSNDIFEQWAERDIEDMVRRDRNHLSIFAWSIGNEVDYPNDPYSHPVLSGGAATGFTQPIFGGYKKDAPDAMRLGVIAKRLAAAVRKYDLSRPVTAGLAGVAMSNETEYPVALDIAGYNYTESLYENDHKKFPNRVIYGSENRHDMKDWRAVADNDYIFGQFLWTGIDYLGESGAWPSRGFYSGLLDFGGFVKPRGYFRQSLWSDKPMIYAGTYVIGQSSSNDVLSAFEGKDKNRLSVDAWNIWNYDNNSTIRVVCYTNTPKARLMLNGKEYGAIKPYDKQTGIIHWDVPFQRGRLEAQGLDDAGNIVATYTIESSDKPAAIKVEKVIKDKDSGLVQIILQVVDENGVNVMLADNEVSCNISSNAVLLGMEASNNTDMGDYTDNKQRVFNGRLLVYLRINDSAPVQVNFTSAWLKSANIEI